MQVQAASATPLVQAKGISEVRLLRRRTRYVVNGIPIEIIGMPFALIYATLGVHMLTLVVAGKWCAAHARMHAHAGTRVGLL